VNAAQLPALFAAHKTAVLGTAAAAVAGLALYQRHKAAGGSTGVGGTVAGALPAAAVAGSTPATGGGVYDSTSFDLYNALQPEIDAILQLEQNQQTGGAGPAKPPTKQPTKPPAKQPAPASHAPAPIASTLFAPTMSGKYVRYNSGLIAEVEKDGSQLNLTQPEWQGVVKRLGSKLSYDRIAGTGGGKGTYDVAHNLARAKR